MLQVTGQGRGTVFGLTPSERLERQVARVDTCIVAHPAAILDDSAINWLVEHRGIALATRDGLRLAAVIESVPKDTSKAGDVLDNLRSVHVDAIEASFARKLRRRVLPLAISLDEMSVREAEWLLFKSVYKGVTDVVTKWLWPVPAFYVTKVAAQLGIRPNTITFLSFLLTLMAGWLFYEGQIALGLAAAWLMTFLDTVDGKLARVTVTSSRLGNWLDHGMDVIHPPLWWLCLARGLAANDPELAPAIWTSCGIILGTYVVGRLIEVSFHLFFGFNGYLLSQIDALFRLIVARRNVILLLITVGILVQEAAAAFVACAAWSAVCVMIQAVRLIQALIRARSGELKPFLA